MGSNFFHVPITRYTRMEILIFEFSAKRPTSLNLSKKWVVFEMLGGMLIFICGCVGTFSQSFEIIAIRSVLISILE